ncbi:hypothetical protein A5714_06820 [Mycobacterium sp. E2462]|uniref:ESX-1 secretion-associated protein n=1 Tax=unclassified Mycobacterium TaxID=2642494 RepID=UPI0007FBDAF0|nr:MULTISPECIES: ESX-1 secretion-associated protein [unclassified Mycobacterium]OBG75005.1 hypothetical protein A5700_03050 [Mycobacterium sp. E1214]OBH27123.1 hypothetical protein A5693_24480 [Mycobacterium sp. E1319]OBI21789.1 hypothetical protein A5714_06820 [Mycobacterium sp. E2462]
MATEFKVSPSILETLARNQTDAAKDAQAAADAVSGTGSDCWVTHGVISGSSNGAFDAIETSRKAAGSALANASSGLAAKLRAAKQAYEGVDGELADNLNKQMLDK